MIHPLIGEVAPAVGPAAGASIGLAGLLTFLAGIALLGLHYGWTQTFGRALRYIANWIRNALTISLLFGSVDIGGPIASAFDWLDHAVSTYLADGAESCLHAASWCFHEAGAVFWWSVYETEHLALDTYRAFDSLFTAVLPRWSRDVGRGLENALRASEAAATHALHDFESEIRKLIRAGEARIANEVRHAEHAIEGVVPRVSGLERDFEWLRKRFATIERTLSRSALVALIGATIFSAEPGGFGLGPLRCPGWLRFLNKGGCGLGNLLADLVEGLIAVMVVEDICAITHAAIDVVESSEVQGFLTSVVTDMDNLLTCQGVTVAAPLTGPYYAPPPVQPYAVLG